MFELEIPINEDGPIWASQLAKILTPIVSGMGEAFEAVEARLDASEAKVKRLQNELDTERRLRLGSRKQ